MSATGRLKHRVTLKSQSRVSDDMGGYDVTWATVATFWARLKPVKGNERNRADGIKGEAAYTLEYRALEAPSIDTSMQISYGGQTYAVSGSPTEDEDGVFMMAPLTRGVPA